VSDVLAFLIGLLLGCLLVKTGVIF